MQVQVVPEWNLMSTTASFSHRTFSTALLVANEPEALIVTDVTPDIFRSHTNSHRHQLWGRGDEGMHLAIFFQGYTD